jgi:hypothetical protein
MDFMEVLRATGQEDALLKLSQEVVEMLFQTFGEDGTDHPLFRMLGLDPETFDTKVELVRKSRKMGDEHLEDSELAQILSLLFEISSEKIGPAFTPELEEQVLAMRRSWRQNDTSTLPSQFEPLEADKCAAGLSLLENVLFAKISSSAGAKLDATRDTVINLMADAGLTRDIVRVLFELPTGIAGANMPAAFNTPMAITRAAVKKPDILVFNSVLGQIEQDRQRFLIERLRSLMPDCTLVVIDEKLEHGDLFSQTIEMEDGRFSQDGVSASEERSDNAATADLNRKQRELGNTEMFRGLPRKQLRLLAFGAKWYSAKAGDYVFHQGDDGSDGAYLILEGEAGIYAPQPNADDILITTSGPGTLVGELALIRKVPRALDMKAHTDLSALRLGEQEFLAVVENDAKTAYKILQTIAGYVGVAPSNKEDD